MKKIKITLRGNPISNNQLYKRGKGNSFYMTNEGKSLKESYQWQAKSQFPSKKLFSNNIKIIIELFFGDKRIRDIDNYGKILLDSLTEILWKDDKQIIEMTVKKHIDIKNPRIEIFI